MKEDAVTSEHLRVSAGAGAGGVMSCPGHANVAFDSGSDRDGR